MTDDPLTTACNWAASNPWKNLVFVVLPLILAAFKIAGTV